MSTLTNFYWRGEYVPDVRAFCKAAGMRVAVVESRQRSRNPYSGEWSAWGPWERHELPEGITATTMREVSSWIETQERIVRVEDP